MDLSKGKACLPTIFQGNVRFRGCMSSLEQGDVQPIRCLLHVKVSYDNNYLDEAADHPHFPDEQGGFTQKVERS